MSGNDFVSFDELKEKGNDCVKEKRYEDAIKCYSSALKLRSTEHTVFSNRSLAYLRIGKVEEALSDADKCVELCPTFARGYMRQAVALNTLQQHEKAREAAVAGYLLRGSEGICKECVSQWLSATRHLYKDYYEVGYLPTGTVIVSDAYFLTLFEVINSRSSSTSGMTSSQMEERLHDVALQLKQFLATFGHSDHGCIQEWIQELSASSDHTNPQTSTLREGIKEAVIRKSKKVAEWINSDIHCVLYPIVRPLLVLAVMVVLARTYVLNCMNLGHENIQVLSQACLVLFEQSILNTKEYMGHHLGTIAGLLDSFIGRGTALTSDDLGIMKHYCKEAERLLPIYKDTGAWEYQEVEDIVIRVVANVRNTLLFEDSGKFIHSASLPLEAMMSGEVAKRDALKYPVEVGEYMEKLVQQVKAKNPAELFLRDGENLIHGSVGLMKLCKPQKALEAFMLGEEVHLAVFAFQASRGLWTLEEIPSAIATSRNDLFLTAFALNELDSTLLPRVLVRWKCFYSELRAMLIHFGLKNDLAKTFESIDGLHKLGMATKEAKTEKLSSIMLQYQQGQKIILKKWGPILMQLLFEQSLQMIQEVLESNEVILDFTVLANTPVDVDKPGTCQITGILLLVPHKGNFIVELANFNELGSLSREWSEKLNQVIKFLGTDKQAEYQQEADKIGKRIREMLFPFSMESVINSETVTCLYICPDFPLSNLPLDLLPWTNGKYLFEQCSISYLSCCREVLREWCLQTIQTQASCEENRDNPVHGDDTESKSTMERNPITNSVNTDCVIFADPDYDLQLNSDKESLWEILKQNLAPISKVHTKKVNRLLKSLQEADEVKYLFSIANSGVVKPITYLGKNATIFEALRVKSPLVLHFSTHGFSQPSGGNSYGGNFWTDMTTGLALAGINTYRFGETSKVVPGAGTGELTAMAVCGMNLRHTRLVYLSTCVSSVGFATIGESVGSLSQAFRAAGAETVVATLWPVMDDAARKFAIYFYNALSKPQTKPSEAINQARQELRQEAGFEHWYYWGPFVCIGYNLPLFLV